MIVLHVDHTSTLGGAERSVLELAHSQLIAGDRPILAAGSDGRLLNEARALGIRTIPMGWPGSYVDAPASTRRLVSMLLGLRGAARSLSATVRDQSPDVVHIHTRKSQVVGAWAKLAPPLIVHLRDGVPRRGVLRRLVKIAVERSDHAVALSPWLRREYQALGIMPKSGLIGIVPSGVAQEGLRYLGTPWLDGESRVRVGFVGQIAKWKAPHLLIELAESLTDVRDASFHIIGDVLFPASEAAYGRWLAAKIASSSAADHITWHRAVSSPVAAMEMIDLLVHTSTEPEPFGRVIVEAMAGHRPVIAFPRGGALDILGSSFAYLADGVRVADLATALRIAIGDREGAKDKATLAAREAERYAPERVAALMDKEYAGILR